MREIKIRMKKKRIIIRLAGGTTKLRKHRRGGERERERVKKNKILKQKERKFNFKRKLLNYLFRFFLSVSKLKKKVTKKESYKNNHNGFT